MFIAVADGWVAPDGANPTAEDIERGKALTEAGWLSALIPEEYGGSNLSLTEASVVMEEINRTGGNSGATWRTSCRVRVRACSSTIPRVWSIRSRRMSGETRVRMALSRMSSSLPVIWLR